MQTPPRPHGRPDRRPFDPNRLCEEHFGLVARVVRRHRAIHPVSEDDLESAAQLALVSCSRRWSPERGVPFERYAFRRMDGAVIDEIRRIRFGPTHGDAAQQPATMEHHEEAGAIRDDHTASGVIEHLDHMTDRQRVVCELRLEGYSTREIAWLLEITPRGVRGIAYAGMWRAGLHPPRPDLINASDIHMLEMSAQGMPVREQAAVMGKSYEGAKKQRGRIQRKLGARTMSNALAIARATGLIAPAQPVDLAA